MTRSDIWLCRLLRLIAYNALLAFLTAVMPAQWIEETSEWLGFEPFPESPLTYYLARNLSLMYGFVGATLLVIVNDYQRYHPAIRKVAVGTMLFGLLQGLVNVQRSTTLVVGHRRVDQHATGRRVDLLV